MTDTEEKAKEEQIQVALARLKAEERGFRLRLALSASAWIACFLLIPVGIWRTIRQDGGLFDLTLCLGLFLGGLLLSLRLGGRSESRALTALSELQDVRMIGPLLEALPLAAGEKRMAITGLLTDLLPQVQPYPSGPLTAAQRQVLYDALRWGDYCREPDFLIAAIKALAELGDSQALPLIQSLAAGPAGSSAEQRVQDTAKASLPQLEVRIKQQQISHVLLRPSDSIVPRVHELLRPARKGGDAASEQLLRIIPAQKDPND